jgi:hypothetical protein
VTEKEPREAGIDALLRRSMSAPVPTLPPDFNHRVARRVRPGSRPLNRYYSMLLAGYGLSALLTSVVIMRGGGLNWAPIAEILTPLALLSAWRVAHTALRADAK